MHRWMILIEVLLMGFFLAQGAKNCGRAFRRYPCYH
jgi:hypothetical protein